MQFGGERPFPLFYSFFEFTEGNIMSNIYGSSSDDNLIGTSSNDRIFARRGNDFIDGGAGNDRIYAGRGNDIIDGGAGNDRIYAGRGNDIIDGGAGNDRIYAGRGNDIIDGGAGNDRIYAGRGNDTITAGSGNDVVYAGKGNDLVMFDVEENTGSSYNFFNGGRGNDTLKITLTQAQYVEMSTAGVFTAFAAIAGTRNTFDFSSFGLSFNFNLYVKRFENIEVEIIGPTISEIFGTVNDDVLVGTSEDDIIHGLEGDDIISGGDGADQIFANEGDDTITVNNLDGDTIDGGDGIDTIIFDNTSGDITVDLSAGTASSSIGGSITLTNVENIDDQSGDSILIGDNGDNLIDANNGNDTITAMGGNDTIIVSDGGDTILGGDGTDHLIVTADVNTFINMRNGQTRIDGVFGSISGVENVTIGDGQGRINGNSGNNILTGGAANDTLDGGTGADTLLGMGGNDIIIIDDLNGDYADGGAGNNHIFFNYSSATNYNMQTGEASLDAGNGTGTFINFLFVDVLGAGGAISGTDGMDFVSVHNGGHTVSLLGGDDFFTVDSGGETLIGGDGQDRIRFAFGTGDVVVDISLGTYSINGDIGSISEIENASGGAGNDVLIGDGGSNVLFGSSGDDVLRGGGGDDLLTGGVGNDTFIFNPGDGNDTIFASSSGAGSEDVFDIQSFGFASFAALQSVMSTSGTYVDIQLDATTSLHIENTTISTLHADDFLI